MIRVMLIELGHGNINIFMRLITSEYQILNLESVAEKRTENNQSMKNKNEGKLV